MLLAQQKIPYVVSNIALGGSDKKNDLHLISALICIKLKSYNSQILTSNTTILKTISNKFDLTD
jgi:hypothetical protein